MDLLLTNQNLNLFPSSASVACQGVRGANSQTACEKLFEKPDIKFFPSFEAVFSAVEKGVCSYGIIPIENSTAGSVNLVYDLMINHKFYIVRSVRIKIEHNLLANKGAKLENIKEIYSHEQAINQCSEFFNKQKNIRAIPCENTAVAARMVKESKRTDIAALASKSCEEYYGLNCLVSEVQNNNNNYTRFICISKNNEIYAESDRTSLLITLPHEPGSLYRFMSRLNDRNVNILKLESRPIPSREFEYNFYFDIETKVDKSQFVTLLNELKKETYDFHYFGSYREVMA